MKIQSIKIKHKMQAKKITVNMLLTSMDPWCQFSNNEDYTVQTDQILFCKKQNFSLF